MSDHPMGSAYDRLRRLAERIPGDSFEASGPSTPIDAGTPTVEGSGRTERELKVWPQYADGLESGAKTFEFRKDDRNPRYAVGDVLRLREFVPEPCREFDAETNTCWWGNLCEGEDGHYTGREWRRRVTYVARGGVIPEGYCCMAIEPVPSPTAARGVTGLPTREEVENALYEFSCVASQRYERGGREAEYTAERESFEAILRPLLSAAEQGARDREDAERWREVVARAALAVDEDGWVVLVASFDEQDELRGDHAELMAKLDNAREADDAKIAAFVDAARRWAPDPAKLATEAIDAARQPRSASGVHP